MKGGSTSFSGKTGFLRIVCLLLFPCLLLSGGRIAAAEAPAETAVPAVVSPDLFRETEAWDTAFETGNGFLEVTDLFPQDLSGFTIGVLPGNESRFGITGDPVRTDGNGIRHYALAGELAETITRLYPRPQSVGPDGTVLWITFNRDFFPDLFIRRDHEILSVSLSKSRGVPDDGSWLERTFRPVCDSYEWSPDGRYVFFRSPETWQSSAPDYLMLPYLLDTLTGEVFLAFSLPGLNQVPPAAAGKRNPALPDVEPVSCGAWDGCFSRDGRSLYLIMYGINLPGWESEKALMRYDLETENTERCCWLPGGACALRDMGDGRLMVCCSGGDWQLVSAGESGYTAAPLEGSAVPDERFFRFYEGLNASDAVLVRGTFALAVIRDRPDRVDEWFVMENPDEGFRKTGSQELAQSIFTGYHFSAVIPVRNTPYVILSVFGLRQVAESWTPITEPDNRLLLLNTDTMAVKPLESSPGTLPGLRSGTASGALCLGGSAAFRLVPDRPVQQEEPDKTQRWLECCNEPADQIRPMFAMTGADYHYEPVRAKKSDPAHLRFLNRSVGRTEGFRFASDVQVSDGRYLLTVTLQSNLRKEKTPEYLIPPVLTEERYAEVIVKNSVDITAETYVETGEMIKGKLKAMKKITFDLYEKVTPEDLPGRADAEELAGKYPSVTEQPLYILSSYATPEDREALQERMKNVYTLDDYWQDFQLVNGSRWSPVQSPVYYDFRSDIPGSRWTQGPVLSLCSLADRLGSSVYRRYVTADPKPASVEALALDGRYETAGIPFRVSLVSVQEEGDELAAVFSVVPEEAYGMIPTENME